LMMLLTFACDHAASTRRNQVFCIVTGFAATAAANVKNEGLFFFLLFSLVFIVKNIRQWPMLWRYAVGCAVPFVVLVFFKVAYAPPSDFAAPFDVLTARLLDFDRFVIIIDYIFTYFTDGGLIFAIMVAFAAAFAPRYFRSTHGLVLILQLLVFIFIYMITGNELVGHLSSSFDRLVHQMLPPIIFSGVAFYAGSHAAFQKGDTQQIS
jgi:hypothetical protein